VASFITSDANQALGFNICLTLTALVMDYSVEVAFSLFVRQRHRPHQGLVARLAQNRWPERRQCRNPRNPAYLGKKWNLPPLGRRGDRAPQEDSRRQHE
jgi:hypothetical protein